MFSTHDDPAKSKSKALFVVGPRCANVSPPSALILNGKELPWVSRCDHLGHTLTIEGTMSQDCVEKRAAFIDSAVKVKETFHFAHPIERISAVQTYCTSFYDSNLWRLRSPEVEGIYASWRTHVKLSWDLPRNCHNYFISHVLAPHVWSVKSSLLSKFHNFFLGLLCSDTHEVSVMARIASRDIRSNFGSNVRLLHDETGLDPWVTTPMEMKCKLREMSISEIPEGA